jgi:hypothetical protein
MPSPSDLAAAPYVQHDVPTGRHVPSHHSCAKGEKKPRRRCTGFAGRHPTSGGKGDGKG